MFLFAAAQTVSAFAAPDATTQAPTAQAIATPTATVMPLATPSLMPASPEPASTSTPVPQTTLVAPAPTASGAATPTPVPPSAFTQLRVSAEHVAYHADRFTVVAEGNVRIVTSNGFILRGRYFTMDVKANRYRLAGHVVVDGPGTHLEGAGLANYLEFGRIYFLASLATPDRVTYLDDRFASMNAGREMPGDAFELPENLPRHPSIASKSVVINTHVSLRFGYSQLNTGVVTVPVPSYVLTLSPNSNFAQNSLAGASFDASYPFAGSANSQTAFHIRTGGGNGVFGALEQRFVWDKSYVVGSISPLNHSLKQYNVLGSTSLTPTLQVQTFAQEQAFQRGGFTSPLNASLYLNLRATQALRHSYLQYTLNQYYQSLLADPKGQGPNGCGQCYGDATHQFIPNHPVEHQIAWLSFEQKVLKLPFKYRLRSGYDYAHDTYGIVAPAALNPGSITYAPIDPQYGSLIGVGVQNVTYSYFGGTLYTPSLKLTHDPHGSDVYFNASFDAQRRYYSLPHQVNATNSSFSLSRAYGTKVNTYLSYTIAHTGDQYGDQQRKVYPVAGPGSIDPAFAGFSTIRTLSEGVVYTPNSNFNASLISAQTSGFPKTVPGLFGPAPLSFTGEVRVRLNRHLLIDVTRSYYYNYGTQRFNPGYGLLISG